MPQRFLVECTKKLATCENKSRHDRREWHLWEGHVLGPKNMGPFGELGCSDQEIHYYILITFFKGENNTF